MTWYGDKMVSLEVGDGPGTASTIVIRGLDAVRLDGEAL